MRRKWAVTVALLASLLIALLTAGAAFGGGLFEGPGGGCAPRLFSGPPGQSGLFYGHGFGDTNHLHLGPPSQIVIPIPAG